MQLLPDIFSVCKHPEFHSLPWPRCETSVWVLQIMQFAWSALEGKYPPKLAYLVAFSLPRQGLWVSLLLIWGNILQNSQQDTGALYIRYLVATAPLVQWLQPFWLFMLDCVTTIDIFVSCSLMSTTSWSWRPHHLMQVTSVLMAASRSLKTMKQSRVSLILSIPLTQNRVYPIRGFLTDVLITYFH